MTTTTIVIPPLISEHYDGRLIYKPIIRDDSVILWKVYRYIKKNLMKKIEALPKRKEKCLTLEKKFLEIYEQAKTKEEVSKTEKKNKTQEPFYRIRIADKRRRTILEGLRRKSYV